jgi:hypothetical protein
MKYELLEPDAWPDLLQLVDPSTFQIPPPHMASAVVARDDEDHGRVSGALFLQPVLHMEPLVISPQYTGRVNWMRMVQLFESRLLGIGDSFDYYVFAPDERIGRMAELSGMTRLPWAVYRKELRGGN